jgi:hypothetical protein
MQDGSKIRIKGEVIVYDYIGFKKGYIRLR